MNIGDKVRLLHSNEEGIISKFVNQNMVEIEIEDGFHIPVKISELVFVSNEETKRFGGDTLIEKEVPLADLKPKTIKAHSGIYTAFKKVNEQIYALYLINNTDYTLLFSIGNERDEMQEGLFSGKLAAKDFVKIREVTLQNFEKWGVYIFQFLFFQQGPGNIRPAMLKRVRYRSGTFFKSLKDAPLLNAKAHLFQIDQDEKMSSLPSGPEASEPIVTKLDLEKLKESMFQKEPGEPTQEKVKTALKAPKLEVDLHIEALRQDFDKLNSSEILEIQITAFESNLESAIAIGMFEITFIHGVGSGKLRQEVHRRLSQNPDVKFYQDARKEKFGFGATLVRLK